MAFSTIVRRSASTIRPLAARLVGGQRLRHTAVFSYLRRGSLLSRPAYAGSAVSNNFAARNFSSSKPSSDQSLLAVIDSEIRCAEETDEQDAVGEAPENFPFNIEDNPGQQTVILTRNYQGETVTVEVSMPDIVTGEENENEDDEQGGGAESSIPILVSVAKKDGTLLEFSCTAFPDEITIDGLSLKNPDVSEEQIAYEGPDFSDLDENLQKAFHKYLELRGIKPSATNFLHEYMLNKDSKEYLRWLNNLKKFVEA